MNKFIKYTHFADIMGVSLRTIETWVNRGSLYWQYDELGHKGFNIEQIKQFPIIQSMIDTNWDDELNVSPLKQYSSIELFAGAGGLALGLHKAGFHHIMLNEIDKHACATLRKNKPEWNVVEDDIHNISFKEYEGKVDFLSGGTALQNLMFAMENGEDLKIIIFRNERTNHGKEKSTNAAMTIA